MHGLYCQFQSTILILQNNKPYFEETNEIRHRTHNEVYD